MGIMLKGCLLEGKKKDIYIEDRKISEINDKIPVEADHKIGCKSLAAIPGLMNCHTHSAMALLRGFADDMPLDRWLQDKIWPIEEKLTEKDVYWGSRLACLEMIRSGTTFFNDMYWHFHGTAKAAFDSGMRARVSAVFLDLFDDAKARDQKKLNKQLFKDCKKYGSRISMALGPHAMYTASEESLLWAKEFAEKHDLTIHFHLSESKKEVDDCLKKHRMRPVEYLDKIGFLCKNVAASHCVWLSDDEIRLMAKHDARVLHNPASNMKLSVGRALPYKKLRDAKITIGLGTDGCASNNNLDMFEEMKIASLLQKHAAQDPTAMPAGEAFDLATKNPARIFKLDCGRIQEGMLADIALIDLKHAKLLPNHNLISNLVYSAGSGCVHSTICDCRLLMQDRKIENEHEVAEKAQDIAIELVAQEQ